MMEALRFLLRLQTYQRIKEMSQDHQKIMKAYPNQA